jgi:methylmalonyl-CoA mutase
MKHLFSEFNETTAQAWKEQIIKDLKGIDFNTLVWKTNCGIDVKPFYTKEDVDLKNETTSLSADWSICEYINVDDEKTANAKALNALQNGASGLVFKISQKTNFETLCKGILFEHIYSLFEVAPEFETELKTFLENKNYNHYCFIESDTILSGKTNLTNFGGLLSINTSIYSEAGANPVNQLAFSVSHINDYLNELTTQNKLAELKILHITTSVGGDFFMEICKLRALRKLAIFILEQYNCTAEIHIHAQTTLVNKTTIDVYNNLLRSTTETMSASIGGANSIVVFPFDYKVNPDNDFSSRMARNQQLILKDESYLNKVSDIAAGSYYIETITKTLCEKAWEIFKDIETKGGLINALKLNYIQALIKEDADKLIADFKDGKLILVGVNKFQNKLEEPKTSINSHIENVTQSLAIQPIKALRLA